jgi:hypothetical protein
LPENHANICVRRAQQRRAGINSHSCPTSSLNPGYKV